MKDSSDLPYEDFKIIGKSEQEGTPTLEAPISIRSVADDVNLFDEIWKQGFYDKATGTFYENTEFVCSKNPMSVKSNKDITFNIEEGYLVAVIFMNNSTFLSYIDNPNGINPFSFKTPENCDQMLFYAWKDGGLTVETVGKTKIQEGKVATHYSEYGKGTIEIRQVGKNKLDITKASDFSNGATTYNQIENGLKISGLWGVSFPFKYDISKNNTFILSADYECITKGDYIVPKYRFRYSDGTYSERVDINKPMTATLNVSDVLIYISDGQSKAEFNIINPQLEEGSIATVYEPYVSTTHILQTEPLRNLPNGVHDSIEADGIHRRVGTVVFDGSDDENWHSYVRPAVKGYTYFIEIANTKPSTLTSMCSHFKNAEYAWEIGEAGQFSDHGTFKYKYFVTDKPTVEEWKQWLQQNPMQVDYELAEEVIEPFELPEMSSFKGTTDIATTNEIKPVLDVTYYKDLSTQNKRLEDRLTAIEELLSTTATSALLLDNMKTDLESEV